mgnify:FL=1
MLDSTRDVVSVSTSRSRDRLETSQGLVSVSSRTNWQTSRSRLGLGAERLGLGLGLDREGLGDMVPRPYKFNKIIIPVHLPMLLKVSTGIKLMPTSTDFIEIIT